MSLREKFGQFINKYAEIYAEVNKTQNYRHPFGSFIRNDIPNQIRSNLTLDQSQYIVKGSNGAGRWTTVPWIAIFDRRITQSAQRGVYLVYLLNKDKKELYLTLNQGATDVSQNGASGNDGKLAFTGVTGSSNAKSLNKLRQNALHIQGVVGSVPFSTDEKIECGAPNYDAGAVCYKRYTLDSLPDDEKLFEDLRDFLSIYSRYAEWHLKSTGEKNDGLWWPSREEYDPSFSTDKWIELLNDSEIFTESALKMMAEFYAYGGTATCAQLAEHYQRTYNYYLMTSVHLAERIVKATGCPVVEEEQNAQSAKWWPVLYVGKDASKEEKGTFIWKIREELYEALTEYGIEKHLAERENSKIGTFDSWEIIDEKRSADYLFCDDHTHSVKRQKDSFTNWMSNHLYALLDPNRKQMIKKGKKERADKGYGWHALRHTYAQRTYALLRARGYSDKAARKEVSERLGHHRPDITKVYEE